MTTQDKLVPAGWQLQDLAYLADKEHSANWSDMGCYKTSTALWLMDHAMTTAGIEVPRVLVVTNRSGKGAFFRDIPKTVGNKYTVLNVGTQHVSLVLKDRELKIGKELADEITMPHIVVTHYHVFQRCNSVGRQPKCPECKGAKYFHYTDKGEKFISLGKLTPSSSVKKLPCVACEGTGIVPKPWTQGDRLLNREWDFFIGDEAHRMKNRETKWTVNLKKLKVPRKHIMTGTGFINRPDEIWSLLNFLDQSRFKSYWYFRDYFCEIDNWSGWAVVKGCKPNRVKQFRDTVREYGPRREKIEVFRNLPEPIYEDIDIELNPTQQRMYNEIKALLQTYDQQGYPINSPNVVALLSRLRQICVATPQVVNEYYDEKEQRRKVEIELVEPSAKLDALMDVIDGLRWDDESKQQIVVFSNFYDPLVLLSTRLDKAKIPYIHLKASDNDRVRYEKWKEQFPTKQHQVFMSTVQLGGESIDLTSAQYIAFLDLAWSPKDNNQARDRVWRPGQVNTPVVIRMFAKGTVDHYVFSKVKEKQKWFNEIFGDNGDS